jgi:hypothetical protein
MGTDLIRRAIGWSQASRSWDPSRVALFSWAGGPAVILAESGEGSGLLRSLLILTAASDAWLSALPPPRMRWHGSNPALISLQREMSRFLRRPKGLHLQSSELGFYFPRRGTGVGSRLPNVVALQSQSVAAPSWAEGPRPQIGLVQMSRRADRICNGLQFRPECCLLIGVNLKTPGLQQRLRNVF